MNNSLPVLQLQYGVNAFADHVYKNYHPLDSTAYYPDPEATQLAELIAQYVGCSRNMVLCGNGSDELIDLYIRAHKMHIPDLQVAITPPTYYQYENYGKRCGAQIIKLPHDRSQLDANVVKRHGGKRSNTIVMVDNPANPSGDIVERAQFVDMLEAGFRVFADEAYYEFHGQTMADLVMAYPHQLIVSRSLSKSAAMAGSRVGYVVGDPQIIDKLRTHKMLFNVNSEGQHKAIFALEHMSEFVEAMKTMRAAKQTVLQAIASAGGFKVFDSLDMYAIFKHHKVSSEQLQKRLHHEHGINTYRFAEFKGHDVLRAAVLKPQLMERFTLALQRCA